MMFDLNLNLFDEMDKGAAERIISYLEEQKMNEEKHAALLLWLFQFTGGDNARIILEIEYYYFELMNIAEKEIEKIEKLLKTLNQIGIIERYKLSSKILVVMPECFQDADYIQQMHEQNILYYT